MKWERLFSIRALFTFGAPGIGFIRVAAKAAIIHNIDLGEQGCQCARRSGFGGPSVTANQYAADAGIHGVQDERTLHALLAYNCSKGKNGGHI